VIQPGGVARRIIDCLAAAAGAVEVEDVRIGLGYIAVKLADQGCGVAYSFREQAQGGCAVFQGLRPIAGRSAADILSLLASEDVIEAGVGLACANALANRSGPEHLVGDVLEHLGIRPEDDVGMVGHFGPLVEPIERRARSLTIFERVERPTDLLRPKEEAAEALPRCQVALITATSIINNTVDGLLEAARGCRQVALLGASTPMLPAVFHGSGVSMLSGVVVKKADKVLQVVSEGGGMRQFSPFVLKVTVPLGGSGAGR
jgi:uncharacterized protein (DUF4213/DUF364 family)